MPSPGNKPLPWSALLWPFIWVFCTVAEAWQKHRFEDPPAPQKAVFRLWDKDFNLLATWEDDAKLHLTKDGLNVRWSGVVTKIETG